MLNETETELRRLFEEYRVKDFKVLIASYAVAGFLSNCRVFVECVMLFEGIQEEKKMYNPILRLKMF